MGQTTSYRYLLNRRLGPWLNGPRHRRVLVCMLNPSTADEHTDDPTIRRLIGFGKREEWGHLAVVNLYAARATNPKDLRHIIDPVGPENDRHISLECVASQLVIAAWGRLDTAVNVQRAAHVVGLLMEGDRKVFRFGELTAGGYPRHPLMLPVDAPITYL